MKRTSFAILLFSSLGLTSCGPPEVAGGYCLDAAETADTYNLVPCSLVKQLRGEYPPMPTDSGPFNGTVKEIGWRDKWIVVRRRAHNTEGPHGWMFLKTDSKLVEGPFTDEVRAKLCAERGLSDMDLWPAADAYKLLREGQRPVKGHKCGDPLPRAGSLGRYQRRPPPGPDAADEPAA